MAIRSAASTSLISVDLAAELLGASLDRFALYSAYCSLRNVCRDTSNATATWVGCSSRSTLMSIEVKP